MDGTRQKAAWTAYFQLPMLVVFCLGIASGFPLLLTASTLSTWMKESGVDIKTIGVFALVGLPYTFKFLWAPLVDAIRIKKTQLGHRRMWLLFSQAALVLCMVGMASCDPNEALLALGVFALATAFFSATQDIVIDALRVEMLKVEDQGAGAAMSVAGYRVGMLFSGAGALVLANVLPWQQVYFVAAAVMGSLMLVAPCIRKLHGYEEALAQTQPQPENDGSDQQKENNNADQLEIVADVPDSNENPSAGKTTKGWLYKAVVAPLFDFFSRRGFVKALYILLFIALFKLGDAMAGNLSMPFYLDLGFEKTEIAAVTKVFGFVAVLVGTAIGGLIVKRLSMANALFICGTAQLLSNFVFVLLAHVGNSLPCLVVAIAVENVTGGMGTAAFVAFMASLCNVSFTATQYALFSALSSVGRTLISSAGGFIVAGVGWSGFFSITAACGLPGMLLLFALREELVRTNKKTLSVE